MPLSIPASAACPVNGSGQVLGEEAMHQKFQAMAQGRTDYVVDAFPVHTEKFGTMLCLAGTEEAIYVTREQAKTFFGLVEPANGDKP